MTERYAQAIFEIDVPRCALEYGLSPCYAVLGETGTDRCYKTLATCQAPDAFSPETVTLRFCLRDQKPAGIDCYPGIIDLDYSPSTISLGKDLGRRASLSVTLSDEPHSDVGFDPYHDLRSYDPYSQGTMWGKFRARNPYMRGRACRLRLGDVGDDYDDMEVHHLVIDSFDGPTPDSTFTFVAKDALKDLSGDRALAPKPSTGYLASDISDSATSLTLAPSGIGDEEYPSADFYLNLGGKEIVEVSSRTGDTCTISGRAQLGTTAQAHSAQDRAQIVLRYVAKTAAYIIKDLETTYAGISTTHIPSDAWDAEMANYLPSVYTGTVPEPTPVAQLVSELIEQAALAHWWHDTVPELRLQVLRGIPTSAKTFSEDEYEEGSLRIEDQPSLRVTRVLTRFAQIDPLRPLDEADNYRSAALTISPFEAEQGSIVWRIINSRWIPAGGRGIAERLNDIILSRYGVNGPRRFRFDIARDLYAPQMGAGYRITSHFLQGTDGAAVPAPIQVTRVRPTLEKFEVTAEEMLFAQTGELTPGLVIFDTSLNDVNLRSVHDSLYGAPSHGDEVTCIVEAAATIGSTSTATPALDVGDWPTLSPTGDTSTGSAVISNLSIDTDDLKAGMTVEGAGIPAGAKIASVDSSSQITLDKNATATASGVSLTIYTVIIEIEIRGRIQGAGGKGGNGANATFLIYATAGEDGGTALYTRHPVTITSTDGEIWGGGGGGGGGGRSNSGGSGGGGGGGAGTVAGIGGSSGGGGGSSTNGEDGTSETGGLGGEPRFPATAGQGGDPGQAGYAGRSSFAGIGTGAAGGGPGPAIDGDSWVVEEGSPEGDIRGPRIN